MNEYIPEENLNCTKCGKWDHYCKCDEAETLGKAIELIESQRLKPHQCTIHSSVYSGKVVTCLVCGAEWKQTKGRLVGRDDNVVL